MTNQVTLISSQRYLDQDIVDNKIAAEDFVVTLSPEFESDGKTYQVILDGHHSYHAAIQTDNEPEFEIADITDNDNLIHLVNNDIEAFLESVFVDSEYYNVTTGINEF